MKAQTRPQDRIPDQFLTPRDLAARWRCSIETLKRRRRANILQAYRFGRGVRFLLADVLRIEAEARV